MLFHSSVKCWCCFHSELISGCVEIIEDFRNTPQHVRPWIDDEPPYGGLKDPSPLRPCYRSKRRGYHQEMQHPSSFDPDTGLNNELRELPPAPLIQGSCWGLWWIPFWWPRGPAGFKITMYPLAVTRVIGYPCLARTSLARLSASYPGTARTGPARTSPSLRRTCTVGLGIVGENEHRSSPIFIDRSSN